MADLPIEVPKAAAAAAAAAPKLKRKASAVQPDDDNQLLPPLTEDAMNKMSLMELAETATKRVRCVNVKPWFSQRRIMHGWW